MSLTTSTATWLYVKDDYTSVRMHARQVNGTFQLIVSGPSHQRLFYDGLDAVTLLQRQAERAAALLGQGYAPEPFTTERRSTRDRRRWPRRNDRERRRV